MPTYRRWRTLDRAPICGSKARRERPDRVRITDDADGEARSEALFFDEIADSVLKGEIIEDYDDDKPYPSCLVNGLTSRHELVHSVWACNAKTAWVALITVYRPDPDRWIDGRTRR